MKSLISLACMMMVLIITGYAQSSDSTISIQKKQYYQNGVTKTSPQVKLLLANNPASAPEYKKFKKNSNIGTPLMVVGSAAVLAGAAINLSSSIKESNDINNGELGGSYPSGISLMLVGVACDIVALPLVISANKHFKKSLSDYNSSFKSTSSRQAQFNLMVNANSFGIRILF